MDLRRPTELVLTHGSFTATYEALFTDSRNRPRYADVLGFDGDGACHEKRVIQVLLELVATRIYHFC